MIRKKQSFIDFKKTNRKSIKNWEYFTSYNQVLERYQKFDDFLQFIGKVNKDEFITKFLEYTSKNKDAIKLTPLFTAVRDTNVHVLHDGEQLEFDFASIEPEEAIEFLEKVGFFLIFEKITTLDLASYYIGAEVGLDSNGRKNRGGTLMENTVAAILKRQGIKFISQANKEKIEKEFNVSIDKKQKKDKHFDFAFEHEDIIYLVETNFFNSGGSKVNEVLRSYIQLNKDVPDYSDEKQFKFMFITDGQGLLEDINGLEDAYTSIEHMMNLDDLESGLFE